MPEAENIVNKILTESADDVDSPDAYKNWLGKKNDINSGGYITFGVYIHTTSEQDMRDAAVGLGIDVDNPSDVGDRISYDYSLIETNTTKFLRYCGIETNSEGHDGDALVCSGMISGIGPAHTVDGPPTPGELKAAKFVRQFSYPQSEKRVTLTDLEEHLSNKAREMIYDDVSLLGARLIDVEIEFTFTDALAEWMQVNLIESAEDDVDVKDMIMSMPTAPKTPEEFIVLARTDPVVNSNCTGGYDNYIDFECYVVIVGTPDDQNCCDSWGWKCYVAYPDNYEDLDCVNPADITMSGGFFLNTADDGWREWTMTVPPQILTQLVEDFSDFKARLEKAVGFKMRATMENGPEGAQSFNESASTDPVDDVDAPANYLRYACNWVVCPHCRITVDTDVSGKPKSRLITLVREVATGWYANGDAEFAPTVDHPADESFNHFDVKGVYTCNNCRRGFQKHLRTEYKVSENADDNVDPKTYIDQIHDFGDLCQQIQNFGLSLIQGTLTAVNKVYFVEGFSYWATYGGEPGEPEVPVTADFVRDQLDKFLRERGLANSSYSVYEPTDTGMVKFYLALPKNQISLGYATPKKTMSESLNPEDDPDLVLKDLSTKVSDDAFEAIIRGAKSELENEFMRRSELGARRADEIASEVADKWCETAGYDNESPEAEEVRTVLYRMAGEWFPEEQDLEPLREAVEDGDTLKGIDLVKRLLTIGTAQGGFLDFTLKEVKARTFKLQTVDIKDLLKTDNSFADYADDYTPRDYDADGGLKATEHSKEMIEPENRYDEPIVVIDGMIRDGWSRAAGHLQKGDTKVKAWVAEPEKVNESNLDVWDCFVEGLVSDGYISHKDFELWTLSRTEADISSITDIVTELDEQPDEEEAFKLATTAVNVVRRSIAKYRSGLTEVTDKIGVVESEPVDDVDPVAFIKDQPVYIFGITVPRCHECGTEHDMNFDDEGNPLSYCSGCGRPVPDNVDPIRFNAAPYFKMLVDEDDKKSLCHLVDSNWDTHCKQMQHLARMCGGLQPEDYAAASVDPTDVKTWFEYNAPDWVPLLKKSNSVQMLHQLQQESAVEDLDDPKTVIPQHDTPLLTAELQRLGFKELEGFIRSTVVHCGEDLTGGGFRYKNYLMANGEWQRLGLSFGSYQSSTAVSVWSPGDKDWHRELLDKVHASSAAQAAAIVRDLDAAMVRGAQDSLSPKQMAASLRTIIDFHNNRFAATPAREL